MTDEKKGTFLEMKAARGAARSCIALMAEL